jgi:hypothetical protein
VALLLDNDIVHKLAQLNFLEKASQLLKEEYGELKVLNTLKFKFCPKQESKRTKAEKKFSSLIVERIEAFIQSGIAEINQEVTDVELIEAANSVSGLNDGEMQLLQALLNEKGQLFFTGDKRFLKALANTLSLQNKLAKIQNHFVCFEQILLLLIKKLSFEIVRVNYIDAKNNYSIDLTLRICFSSEPEKIPESQFISNLEKYIEDLQLETNHLLIPTPLLLTTS